MAALQGGVTEVEVQLLSPDESRVVGGAPNMTSVVVTELEPNTQYEIHVTLIMHGGATITSDPAYAQTRDGGKLSNRLCFHLVL